VQQHLHLAQHHVRLLSVHADLGRPTTRLSLGRRRPAALLAGLLLI
jgi:ABC-type uncharacterized transport system ATPase subunit